MSSAGQLSPSLGQLDTSSKAPSCLQEGHGEVWGVGGEAESSRRAGNNFFQCEKLWEEGNWRLDGRTHTAASLLTYPGGEQQHLQQENLLLPGNKEGKGSLEEDVFILPCSYIILQECRPLAGSPSRVGPRHTQPPCLGYSRWPWDVEELGVVMQGAARLALLLRIQTECVHSLVVRSHARSPCFAQKTKERGSAAGFQGASFVELVFIRSIPRNRVGLGGWEPILTHQPGVVRSRHP